MVFSSLIFLCIFLPVVFLLYYLTPTMRLKNILLIVASFIFYAYGEPVYVILMFASCLFNYWISRMIMWREDRKKIFAVLAVIINIGLMCVFKYTGFLVQTVNSAFGLSVPVPQISLPVGISFFTFQALSYVIDVYRDPKLGEKNILNIFLYISFFPQLIAGPIVKFHDVIEQIHHRAHSVDRVVNGICRFCTGLAKKVLLANMMAVIADDIFALPAGELNIFSAWLGAIAYAFQIYYDFGGYSDMALGMAQMFGFHFQENFNVPYTADGIQDFWHRWHISLSTWFKEYLYIPLGGNRKGKVRTVINRYIVFFCTGLWHGANWTFILWGLIHGTLLVLENTGVTIRRIPVRWVRQALTWVLVVLAFVIFRADTVSSAFRYIGAMFAGVNFGAAAMTVFVNHLTPVNLIILLCCFLSMRRWKFGKYTFGEAALGENGLYPSVVQAGRCVVSVILLGLCMMSLASNAYNPFIYFRF